MATTSSGKVSVTYDDFWLLFGATPVEFGVVRGLVCTATSHWSTRRHHRSSEPIEIIAPSTARGMLTSFWENVYLIIRSQYRYGGVHPSWAGELHMSILFNIN